LVFRDMHFVERVGCFAEHIAAAILGGGLRCANPRCEPAVGREDARLAPRAGPYDFP